MAVYFIRAGEDGPIKIGHSNRPLHRLMELQVSHWQTLHLRGVLPGGEVEEAEIHSQFSHAHIRGEWHWPVSDLVAFMLAADAAPESAVVVRITGDGPSLGSRKLKAWLTETGTRQVTVAKCLIVSTASVNHWLSGRFRPSLATAYELESFTSGAVLATDFAQVAA
jgi:DNA-binding XRE family transcriptional regulator